MNLCRILTVGDESCCAVLRCVLQLKTCGAETWKFNDIQTLTQKNRKTRFCSNQSCLAESETGLAATASNCRAIDI